MNLGFNLNGFDTAWYAALILSIPISIVSQFMGTWIQKWFENPKSEDLESLRAGERRVAAHLMSQFSSALDYLIYTGIRITYVGAIMGAVSGVFFTAGQILVGRMDAPFGLPNQLLFTIGTTTTVVGSIIMMTMAARGIRNYQRIRAHDASRTSQLLVVPSS